MEPREEVAITVVALDGGLDDALPFEMRIGVDEGVKLAAGFLMQSGITHDAAADFVAGEFELGLDEHRSVAARLHDGQSNPQPSYGLIVEWQGIHG